MTFYVYNDKVMLMTVNNVNTGDTNKNISLCIYLYIIDLYIMYIKIDFTLLVSHSINTAERVARLVCWCVVI